MLETEVQADFAFLTTRGEVASEDAPGTIKVLVLTELSSGCIGYVVVESDVSKVRTQICRWLEHFGLTSTTTGVILHTDAERAVAELVGKSSERYTFNVRRANPQQHQSVGAAERAVRRLKESLSVLRADLNSGGADVTFNESGLTDALTYIGLTHNHFSKVQGSDMSPLEFTVNRPLSKPATALFGQTVLAELPSSLRQLCPNETRSVEACFIHPGLNTGPVVQGIFRVDGEQVLKRFVARNLRPIFPVAWNHSLGADVLMKFDNANVEDLDAQPAVADGQLRQPQVGVDPTPEESNVVEYPDGAHLRWSDNGDYMMSPMQLEIHGQKCLATSPEFFDDLVSSVKFAPDKKHTFCKMTLGGATVLVWKPDGLVDDSSLMSLDNEQGFEGMKEEIRNLEHCQTGRIISHSELTALKAQNPHLRLIPSRWVSAYKSPTRVRARIVAKDLNRGVSARKLGISSPTPSVDGLHFVLALAAQRQWQLKGLDVAHAFMHSPIPKRECIVLQMPQSVSLEDGSLAYLVLYRALNGLRDASLAWLNLLSESIKAVGLFTDDMEPCIYQGCIRRKGRQVGSAILIAYVDDLLLCSDSDEVEKIVEETIGAVVPLKETGKIKKAAQGGGSLIFIGRHIFRDGHKNDLRLGVDPKFLDAVFKEFNISKGSAAIPDVAAHIEKTVDDVHAQVPLSAEAYARFRRALGKLLWMAQVRHDIKIYLSLIGSQQASPMNGTESAIRAILRFLYNDMSTMLSIPSPEYFEHACPGWDEVGVVYTHSLMRRMPRTVSTEDAA